MKMFRLEASLWIAFEVLIYCPFKHREAFVTGSELPKMLQISDANRIKAAVAGKPFTLRCPVDTTLHTTFIEWSKGCMDLYNKDSEGYTVTERGVLRIRNVTMANAGLYICNATNGHGSISIKFMLIVTDPRKTDGTNMNHSSFQFSQTSNSQVPKIEKPQVRNFREESGGAMAIHCSAVGYPAPHIFWTKDGKLVDGGGPDLESKRTRSRSLSSLILPRLQKTDSGVYRCIARNSAGKDEVDFSLEVVDPQYPPEILSLTPPNSTVIAGHMVVFRCKGKSLPVLKLRIKWMKTIRADQMNQSNRTFHLASNYYKVLDTDEDPIMANNGRFQSELLIPNATIHDSGTYVCLAVNDRGYRYKNVSLKVVTQDRMVSPYFVTSPSPSFVVFVIFTAAIVMAPIIFLMLLHCKRRLNQKINLAEIPTENEVLRQPTGKNYQIINEGCEHSSAMCAVKTNHQTSKLLSTHDTKVYDYSNGCKYSLDK